MPGSTFNEAYGINDSGQVVGASIVGGVEYATEWSGGSIINLGKLTGSTFSAAYGINDAGQIVGIGTVPESSTWAMMLISFGGLAFAGYRRARAGCAALAL